MSTWSGVRLGSNPCCPPEPLSTPKQGYTRARFGVRLRRNILSFERPHWVYSVEELGSERAGWSILVWRRVCFEIGAAIAGSRSPLFVLLGRHEIP